MSFSGSVEAIVGRWISVPSTKETRIRVAPSTTWNAVRIEPRLFTITPVPSPRCRPSCEGLFVSISTSDGRICW